MNKFKVGDRVKVYGHIADCGKYQGYYRGHKAIVTDIVDAKDELRIKFVHGDLEAEVHPRQCRKIKVKTSRSLIDKLFDNHFVDEDVSMETIYDFVDAFEAYGKHCVDKALKKVKND